MAATALCELCTRPPPRGEMQTTRTKKIGLAYRWFPMACRSRSAAAEGAPPLVEVILPNLGGGRTAGLLVFSLLLALRVDKVGTALEDLVDR